MITACSTIGTPADILEAVAALGPIDDLDIADQVVSALDAIEADADLEDDGEREPEDGEAPDLPPLMDGGWGYTLGRLEVWEACGCCGHREFAGFVAPVEVLYEGASTVVANLTVVVARAAA
jgi:hypothetical protein